MTEMTNKERSELQQLARARARVAKQQVKQRQAQLLAQVEQELSERYAANHEAWAHITNEAEAMVREADEKIAAICRELGVREEFRPHLNLSWWSRGENADNQRRTELRKRAQTAIAAQAEQAKYEIDRQAVEVQTQTGRRRVDNRGGTELLGGNAHRRFAHGSHRCRDAGGGGLRGVETRAESTAVTSRSSLPGLAITVGSRGSQPCPSRRPHEPARRRSAHRISAPSPTAPTRP